MHCTSFVFIVSSLCGVGIARPAPPADKTISKPEVATVDQDTTSASEATMSIDSHKTPSPLDAGFTTVGHKRPSSAEPMVTRMSQKKMPSSENMVTAVDHKKTATTEAMVTTMNHKKTATTELMVTTMNHKKTSTSAPMVTTMSHKKMPNTENMISPPGHKTVSTAESMLTTMKRKKTSTSVAMVTTMGHKKTPTAEPTVTTMKRKKTSTSVAMVTTMGHKKTSPTEAMVAYASLPTKLTTVHGTSAPGLDVTTAGDGALFTATLVEIEVYPLEWTTIPRSPPATSGKAQGAGAATMTEDSQGKTTMTKVSKTAVTENTVNKVTATRPKTAKTTKPVATSSQVAPVTCTTYYPTILRQISEAFPDIMQENTANTTKAFLVGQSVSFSDKVKFNRIHQYVVFDKIASGSLNCELKVSWPGAKHGGLKVKASSPRSSSAISDVSLDVYSAFYNSSAYGTPASPQNVRSSSPNDSGPFSTWANMMGAIKASGNRQLPASDSGKGQEKSDLSSSAKLTYFGTVAVHAGEHGRVINSLACPASGSDTLQFLFEIPATDSREVSVHFLATKEKGAGVYLLANC